MSIFLQDSFVNPGVTNVNLNTRTPEIGGAWIQAAGLWGSSGTAFIYPDNHVRTNTNAVVIAYNNASPATNSIRVSADLGRFTNVTTAQCGLLFCADPAGNNAYYIRFSNLLCRIVKVTAGSSVIVATTPSNAALYGIPNPGPIRAVVTYNNGLISVFRDGDLILSYEDPSPLPAGFTGLTTSGTGYIDNLVSEDVVSATPTTATASGSSTAEGFLSATKAAVASVVASSDATGQSNKFLTGFGNAIGMAGVAGVGITINIVSGRGVSTSTSIPDFRGVAAVTREATASAEGAAVGEFISDLTQTANGLASGAATVIGVGRTLKAATFTVTASASVAGVVTEFGEAMAEAAGVASSAFVGASVRSGVGVANGVAEVTGMSFTGADGLSEGRATVTGRGRALKEATGSAQAGSSSSLVTATIYDIVGQGEAGSLVVGVGHQIIETIGQITASSDSYFLSFGIQIFPVNPDRIVILPAEDRRAVLRFEDRLVVLPRADLTALLERAARTVELPAEDFRVVLPAEDRAVTLAQENRMIVL